MGHRFSYLDAPPPLAFAHRGGAGAHGLENTAAAFDRAVKLGYRYLETDVHATRDQVAVVFHDVTLARMTGRPEPVTRVTWKDLETVRVGGAAAVPRLDDVLDAWPQVRFNIDIKADPAVRPALAAIDRCAAHGRVLLASFNDTRLARLRALAGPAVPTSVGARTAAKLRLAAWTGRRVALPASVAAVQVPVRRYGVTVVDAHFVNYVHRLGLPVHVWTINDAGQMHDLLDLGVDGIMTDHVDVLRDVYLSRGCWPPHR